MLHMLAAMNTRTCCTASILTWRETCLESRDEAALSLGGTPRPVDRGGRARRPDALAEAATWMGEAHRLHWRKARPPGSRAGTCARHRVAVRRPWSEGEIPKRCGE